MIDFVAGLDVEAASFQIVIDDDAQRGSAAGGAERLSGNAQEGFADNIRKSNGLVLCEAMVAGHEDFEALRDEVMKDEIRGAFFAAKNGGVDSAFRNCDGELR